MTDNRDVKQSSRIWSSINKSEFKFGSICISHSWTCTQLASQPAALSVSLARGCTSSTCSWWRETWLGNHYCDGRLSAQRDTPSTVAQFLLSLDTNRPCEMLAVAFAESAVSVYTKAWPVDRDAHASIGLPYFCLFVFSPNVCFPESSHTRPCMSANFMSIPLL